MRRWLIALMMLGVLGSLSACYVAPGPVAPGVVWVPGHYAGWRWIPGHWQAV